MDLWIIMVSLMPFNIRTYCVFNRVGFIVFHGCDRQCGGFFSGRYSNFSCLLILFCVRVIRGISIITIVNYMYLKNVHRFQFNFKFWNERKCFAWIITKKRISRVTCPNALAFIWNHFRNWFSNSWIHSEKKHSGVCLKFVPKVK